MKTNVKVIVAALCTAGLISPPLAFADTISAPPVAPVAQSVVPGTYTVTYPVTITLAGGAPQVLNFIYNSNGTWTAPPGYTFSGYLNPSNNTAVFVTGSGATAYGVSISSTGTTQFIPGQTGAVTVPPSVGTAPAGTLVTGTVLPGFAAATATGTVVGNGQTTATLVPAGALSQLIGVGSGGVPVGTAVTGAPITVVPTSATSPVGNAAGSVLVNSNQAAQAIGWGQYTVTVPLTPAPAGTTTVNGTVAGSSGSVGASGIRINNISGTATYNTLTGVINATPTETAVFSVDTSGNTAIGGTLSVAGATTTKGITNTGNIATTTLGVSGSATVGGTLGVTGNTTLGGTLGVTGNTTVGGTLGVTGATTLGSAAGTAGNTVVVSSSGVTASGGGATVALANNRATFSGTGGAPLILTGIANGQNQYDAVNFGQVQEIEKNMSRGISGATAVANIPQVDQGKQFAVGVGVGGFNGETAFAIGGSARIATNGVLKASVGFAGGGGSNTVWGVGGVWNW